MSAISPLVGSPLAVAPPPASIGPEERHLLCSLVESSQFGPAVKTCFDRQWVGPLPGAPPGSEGPWRSILAESVGMKQAQIRQICQEHYSEFLAGIEHLLSVKLDLSELRALAQSLNASVQASGRAVVTASKALHAQRRIRSQLNSAQQILQSCASLLALARKAKGQIKACKYFSALKTLHQLQRILHVAQSNAHKANQAAMAAAQAHASSASTGAAPNALMPERKSLLHPSSSSSHPSSLAAPSASSSSSDPASAALRFDFLRQLERQIPLLTSQIKESVKADFQSWLGSISRRSQAIGELALGQLDDYLTALEKRRMAARKQQQARRLRMLQRKSSGGDKSSRRRTATTAVHDDEDDEDEDGDDDGMDPFGNGGVGAGGGLNAASLFDAHPINFTSVYQCLHIYEHLNLAEQFQRLYKEKRHAQLMETIHALSALGSIGSGGGSGSGGSGALSPRSGPTLLPKSPSGSSVTSRASPSPSLTAQPSPTSPSLGPSADASDILELYTRTLAGITGFFVVEDSILKSGNELVSRAEMDTLYERVQMLLIQYLTHHLATCQSLQQPATVLQLKYALLLQCKAMDEGFLALSSHLLLSCLMDQRPRFEALLLKKFAADTRVIFQKEKWEPLGINDQTEWQLFVLGFGLGEQGVNVDFPCTCPFSISVPLLSRALLNFIEDYFSYGRYLEEGGSAAAPVDGGGGAGGGGAGKRGTVSSSWKTHVLRAVDRALTGEVNRTFLEMLGASSSSSSSSFSSNAPAVSLLPISQTVQFSINAQVLSELTCPFMERYIEGYGDEEASGGAGGLDAGAVPLNSPLGSPLPLSPSGSSSSTRLTSRSLLLSTKLHCEDLLFELIGGKLDAFLDIGHESSASWTPDTVADGPSEHVLDAVAWLETTLATMAFMPDAVREAAHFTSCKHMADALLAPLVDPAHPTCRKFNIMAVANLQQDLRVLEAFAQRCPIQNLVETFSEIRQLLDLLLSGDVESLLDPQIRASRYAHLSTHKLLRVFDKFKDVSLFSINTPAQFKKLKKKNVDAVAKRLKQSQQ